MKACREIGGPLSNAGLAAAVVQTVRLHKGKTRPGACFHCGHQGHLKKQCPMRGEGQGVVKRAPGLCPICKKGNHWANECRSIKDINGRPISKNGRQGPRSQGPQIYGAVQGLQERRQLSPREGQLQAPRDWTSAAPPESY